MASFLPRVALCFAGTLVVASSAQAQYGPYTCVNGLVWREAVPNDFVCVNGPWRTKTQQENAQGPSFRQPGGGPYGPDTCKQGYVWRETRPSDHVCVSAKSGSRKDNRRANRNAYTGYAHPDQLPSNGTSASWENINGKLVVSPSNQVFYAWEPGKGYLRGFGNYGNVYGARAVTPAHCQQSSGRTMYVLAVDEVTGIVSNAGAVKVPLCRFP